MASNLSTHAIVRLLLVAAAVVAGAALLAACQDDQESSGTSGAADPSSVPGVENESVLEFDGKEYRVVAVFREDLMADEPNLERVGEGVVRDASGEQAVEVLRLGDEDDQDERLYTRAPRPLEGGVDTTNLLYEWSGQAEPITPTLPE